MSTPEEREEQVRISPLTEFGVVGVGGAVGALGRYWVAEVFTARPFGLPLATLVVNLVGCLAIGWAAATIGRHVRQRVLWWFVATGVLGGFTTFSSLAVETDLLIKDGRLWWAAGYGTVTITGGWLAAMIFAPARAEMAATAPAATDGGADR